jgi:hypothetical protein
MKIWSHSSGHYRQPAASVKLGDLSIGYAFQVALHRGRLVADKCHARDLYLAGEET